MLLARVVPPTGGDTTFANIHAAYAALPEKRKRQLLRMRAHHSSRCTFGAMEAIPSELRAKFRKLGQATQDAIHLTAAA